MPCAFAQGQAKEEHLEDNYTLPAPRETVLSDCQQPPQMSAWSALRS
jgi:hypothetical protein